MSHRIVNFFFVSAPKQNFPCFENFVTYITKVKSEEKKKYFSFTDDIRNLLGTTKKGEKKHCASNIFFFFFLTNKNISTRYFRLDTTL